MAPSYSDSDWGKVVALAKTHGMDLRAYKRDQVERRVMAFMSREGYSDATAMTIAATRDPAIYRKLHSYLTIHVTEFFRDALYWERFRDGVVPLRRSRLKIWSAGCSVGAEPVTAALLIDGMGYSFDILATDSDEMVLDDARRGVYPQEMVAKVPMPYRERFQRVGDGFKARAFQSGAIRYMRHNLLTDPSPGHFDIIICRNLLIYFERETRAQLLRGLAQAIEPGGLLFLGAMETFMDFKDLGFQLVSPSIYRKI